jgi:hypothetical protein
VSNLWPGDFLVFVKPLYLGLGSGVWWKPQWFDRAVDIHGARVISISADGEINKQILTLERGGVISGSVHAIAVSDDFHGLRVTYADTASAYLSWPLSELPADFTAEGLGDGNYKIGVHVAPRGDSTPDSPPFTVWYPGTTDWDEAAVISIRDAGTVSGLVIEVP